MTEYEAVIGLEVHAQLLTKTKIFCGCTPVFGDAPNSHVCPVCLGLPGALPVLNRTAVEMAVLMGRAVNCTIAEKSIFARKNYFYPDLTKGYQISQYDMPLCVNGFIDIRVNGAVKRVGIIRIHLEEDAGKLIHDQDIDSLFDANRCGTPLIEIVSEPDIRSAGEAYAYLVMLRQILSYLGICDCNMEEGSLRCDANISLRPKGDDGFGTRIELKNMNSFRGVEKALEHEILRQTEIIMSGGTIAQQTVLWDPQQNRTVPMRSKESAHDYRYFPEPDIVPLIVNKSWVESIERRLPELGSVRRDRFVKDFGLSVEHADVLTDSRDVADYFESTVACGADARLAANWIMVDILRIAKETRTDIARLLITPQKLAALISLVKSGEVSANAAKRILDDIQLSGGEPQEAIERLGLRQISDSSALQQAVRQVLDDNPQECERLKGGEMKLMSFFIGQTMKRTKGKGNPREINDILRRLLKC